MYNPYNYTGQYFGPVESQLQSRINAANILQGQTYPRANYNAPGLNGRPVASIDEARAAQITLDGSMYFFPCPGENKIYTKTIDLNGLPVFNVYSLDKPAPAMEYAPAASVAELQKRVEQLEGAFNNDKYKPVPNIAGLAGGEQPANVNTTISEHQPQFAKSFTDGARQKY